MCILPIGDVIGPLGRETLTVYIPKLKKKYRPQVTIADGENAASGRGTTGKIYKKFLQDGVDVVMAGNRTWDSKDIFEFIDDVKKMVRPVNFPEDVPDQEMVFVKVSQLELTVINLQAHTFMVPLEDPFEKAAELVAIVRKRTPLIFVDFRGETMSEKQAASWFLDGQASAAAGAYTHVQTNDTRILPKGMAFLDGVGMIGLYDGILGMKREPIIEKFMTALPKHLEIVETGRTTLSTCILGINGQTDRAKIVGPIQVGEGRPFQE